MAEAPFPWQEQLDDSFVKHIQEKEKKAANKKKLIQTKAKRFSLIAISFLALLYLSKVFLHKPQKVKKLKASNSFKVMLFPMNPIAKGQKITIDTLKSSKISYKALNSRQKFRAVLIKELEKTNNKILIAKKNISTSEPITWDHIIIKNNRKKTRKKEPKIYFGDQKGEI